MSARVIALTGATGFIGSAVLRRLCDGDGPGRDVAVRVLTRTAPAGRAKVPGVSWLPVDLEDPASLRGALDGVDVLMHLAARVTGDEAQCRAVNLTGTRSLVDEARRAGVERLLHLSTAAVYGAGPHHGIAVNETAPAPVSAASRTRLAAESPVIDAGGTVLRPGLVLGSGDRWVVPALAELAERVPAYWDGGRALLSVVDVSDLARLLVSLATTHRALPGVFHASDPRPVRNRDLMVRLAALGVLPAVVDDWSWEDCLRRFGDAEGRVTQRQFELLARDHWYRSDEIWRLAGCPEGPGPLARLESAAPWYRAHLTPGKASHPVTPAATTPPAVPPLRGPAQW
ncbi:NAD-dependent epimerase/dehydratase family protein [Streptomyces sp. cmx-18-6]|uniref:NAD-dependent epimerase/dehydratase family protein n=1 Tax=Streptomyces sp. cmx-18-6 TaxID=2790930 RepID=UPI0039813AD8